MELESFANCGIGRLCCKRAVFQNSAIVVWFRARVFANFLISSIWYVEFLLQLWLFVSPRILCTEEGCEILRV